MKRQRFSVERVANAQVRLVNEEARIQSMRDAQEDRDRDASRWTTCDSKIRPLLGSELVRALYGLIIVLVLALAHTARAEDCTHALTVRDGQAHDPDTGAVVPLCDGDLLPTPDVLWLLQREGRATEVTSELELARAELVAERDLHRTDVERLTAEVQAERDARLSCERTRAPAPERRSFFDSPWFGAGAASAIITTIIVIAVTAAK